MMGFGGYGLFGGLGMGFGMVMWVILTALVIWVAIAYLGNRAREPEESPLEILKRRFARGEISQAEFELAKQELA